MFQKLKIIFLILVFINLSSGDESSKYSIRALTGLGWSSQIQANSGVSNSSEIDDIHAKAAAGFPLGIGAGWNISGNWEAAARLIWLSSSGSGTIESLKIEDKQSYMNIGALIGRRPADRSGFVWHTGIGYGMYDFEAKLSQLIISETQYAEAGGLAMLLDLGWTFGIGEKMSIEVLAHYQRVFADIILKSESGLTDDKKLGSAAEFVGLTCAVGYSF